MKKQKKRREFNDLLLPVILTVAVLPFITRLIIYDCGLSKYQWYSANGAVTDFFTYYKSLTFIIISIITAIILVLYFVFQKKDRKDMKSFVPIGIYALLILLSTIFSKDMHTSLAGGFGHFESISVLLGYLVILIYTYRIHKREEDDKVILKAVVISLMIMCMIGILQMAGRDLMEFDWFRRIVIPRQYWSEAIGKIGSYLTSNAVALTLSNPNFAAVYLGMMIPFLTVFILPAKSQAAGKEIYALKKRERIIVVILILLLTILLYKTYSRAGFVSTAAALSVLAVYYRKEILKNWRKLLLSAVFLLLLLAGADYINHFRYMEKIIGTVQSFSSGKDNKPLEEILTGKDGVLIRYGGSELTVSLSQENTSLLRFTDNSGADITADYDRSSKILSRKPFDSILFSAEERNGREDIVCVIDHITWRFFKDDASGYLYINGFGKPDKLIKISRYGFANLENIGSGRGYIWSRTLPLLKDTVVVGTGPDTFPLVFPQSDYVGKANNCKTPYTIIEKPHNLYLMTAVQTGILSLLALLCFLFIYLGKSFRLYKNNDLNRITDKMGLGCLLAVISFMVSGLFNDSSLQTTPIFFVFLGLGMDINERIKRAVSNPTVSIGDNNSLKRNYKKS